MLMIGTEADIEIINDLIDALDVKQQDLRQILQYEIQYVGADEVKNTLYELEIISDGASSAGTSRSRTSRSTSRTSRSRNQPQPQPQTAQIAGDAEDIIEGGEPQVVVLEATNSLLVNATKEQHDQIAMIIAHVDAELEEAANPYVVYPLENQDPEEMADVLQKVVEAQLTQQQQQQQGAKIQTRAQDGEEDKVVIVPDPQTFSIIVYASKKKQEQIGKLIEVLDKRRPQVLIDVALVEITKTDDFEYDLQLVTNLKRSLVGGVGNINIGIIDTDALEGLDYQEIGWNVGSSGEAKGFYGDDTIQALLKLVKSKSYGRVLAQPKLLANDNETGTLTTTTQTWREVKQITYVEGQTQSNPLETTDYKDYTAKIELEITPTISEGDLLRLEITLTREDFLETDSTVTPPNKATTDVTTVVTVPDGDTIILGGLTKLNQNKGGSKIPVLGDIPLVGNAFRSVNNSIEDSYLYIFVKSNIVRPDPASGGMDKIKKISDEYRMDFEEQEKRFQEHKDFTGVKPTRYEPENVLEDINIRKSRVK